MGLKKNTSKLMTFAMFAALLTLLMAARPLQTRAAAKLAKPKLTKTSCSYTNNKVCLAWKKVKGAKKYEIYRAMINSKTGKAGKWKKWASTKKVSIKKKASGDYKYRIRAVNKKKTGKWSTSIRIFAASGQITNMGYTPPDKFLGVILSEGQIEMRVLVKNNTKSPMGFLVEGTRIPVQSAIYAVDSSGRRIKKWNAYIDTGSSYGTVLAKQVNPGKEQSLYFYSFVTEEEWAQYKGYTFMITNSFYPNPTVEPMSTQMALASTRIASQSSIAGK